LVLTPFVVIQKSPLTGAFSLFVLVVFTAFVLPHDLMYCTAITQHKVVWIHTTHVATGVYHILIFTQGTTKFDASQHTMHSGHYFGAVQSPSTHHAISLPVAACCPFHTAVHTRLLVSTNVIQIGPYVKYLGA
jgi:hypothetical protein